MLKNILVPTDGSALSRKAARQAIALAKAIGGRITVFHAAPAYRYTLYADYSPPEVGASRDYAARAKKIAQRRLDAVSKIAAAAGVPCKTCYTISDFPADAIIRAAQKSKCDAIAMATHGRSRLSRMLLGSETTKVLAQSKVPVIVMR
ncbi:MAG TPA: universal stress protein [Burkholderiales bacterium]|nr:universal stress protein [Burkholderiales bacterium]